MDPSAERDFDEERYNATQHLRDEGVDPDERERALLPWPSEPRPAGAEPNAIQLAQWLSDNDVFNDAANSEVAGSNARASFEAEFSVASPWLYEITVVRRARPPAVRPEDPGLLVRVRTVVRALVATTPTEEITLTGLEYREGRWGSAHASGYWRMQADGHIHASGYWRMQADGHIHAEITSEFA